MAETGYIVFYVVFFGLVALVGGLSEGTIGTQGGEINTIPTWDGGVLDAFLLPFQWIGYFVALQGLTVIGISGLFSTFISLIFNVPMIYVVARLARGGG